MRSLSVFAALCLGLFPIAAAACTPSYVVSPGDTLTKISKRLLGDVFAVEQVYEANRQAIGPNRDLIRAGMELTIPCNGTGPIDWSVMPKPQTLWHLLETGEVQVVDIRKSGDGGVVPGARSIPFSEWRGAGTNSRDFFKAARLEALYGRHGLDLTKPIILIHTRPSDMDMGRAAIAYWLLKSSGAQSVAIMRGGMKGWIDAKLPLAEAHSTAHPRVVNVTLDRAWHADLVDVYGVATGQTQGHLLDTRPAKMFTKADDLGKAIATTLPTARNLPLGSVVSEVLTVVDPEESALEVIRHLSDNGFDESQGRAISFCHAGELGALNWFLASELAGLGQMQLYPGSIKGWSKDGGILTVEGALPQG